MLRPPVSSTDDDPQPAAGVAVRSAAPPRKDAAAGMKPAALMTTRSSILETASKARARKRLIIKSTLFGGRSSSCGAVLMIFRSSRTDQFPMCSEWPDALPERCVAAPAIDLRPRSARLHLCGARWPKLRNPAGIRSIAQCALGAVRRSTYPNVARVPLRKLVEIGAGETVLMACSSGCVACTVHRTAASASSYRSEFDDREGLFAVQTHTFLLEQPRRHPE